MVVNIPTIDVLIQGGCITKNKEVKFTPDPPVVTGASIVGQKGYTKTITQLLTAKSQ